MEEFNFEGYKGKIVVLIGELAQEGVTTKIKSLGYAYKQKRLITSTPTNWVDAKELISDLRLSAQLVAVFVHFTEFFIFKCNDKSYELVWRDLVDELSKSKTVFFIYEDNLAGVYSQDPWVKADENTINKANKLIRDLFDSGAIIVPYRKRIHLTTSIQDYLDTLENGILLRLYVPNKQYQDEQLASFLRLLENYLQNVEKLSFTVDIRKTDHGRIYEFKSKNDIQTADDLNNSIARFEAFMELCQSDFDKARHVLGKLNLSKTEVEDILAKYEREYKRLKIDIRHEYEQKILTLRQRLELDILEGELGNTDGLISPSNPSALLSLQSNLGTVNVSIGQILNGDVNYVSEDKQLIELFAKYADKLESISLKSSLDELNDKSSQKEKRQTAKQKIVVFLYKIAPMVGESLVKILVGYLEKILTSSL